MATSLPNLLTYSRIAAIPVVVALLMMGGSAARWIALVVYVAACITDILDGYVARALQQQSNLGQFLDPIADKLLVSSVLLILVGIGTISDLALLPAIVILCREILVSGLREFLAGVQVSVPVSRLAKWKTFLQMTAIGFVVVGEAGPMLLVMTTTEVGVLGLWVAAALTMVTGYDYLRASLVHIGQEPLKDKDGETGGARTQ